MKENPKPSKIIWHLMSPFSGINRNYALFVKRLYHTLYQCWRGHFRKPSELYLDHRSGLKSSAILLDQLCCSDFNVSHPTTQQPCLSSNFRPPPTLNTWTCRPLSGMLMVSVLNGACGTSHLVGGYLFPILKKKKKANCTLTFHHLFSSVRPRRHKLATLDPSVVIIFSLIIGLNNGMSVSPFAFETLSSVYFPGVSFLLSVSRPFISFSWPLYFPGVTLTTL